MIQKFLKYLSARRWVILVANYLKSIKVNQDGATLYQTGSIFFKDFDRNDILDRASGVAFSFTLAIFPALIFLITLVPLLQNFFPELTVVSIMGFLGDLMPASMYEQAYITVEDIVSKPRGGLLSIGAISALYLATNGMMSLIKTFNRCYRTKESRGYFKTLFIATFLTIILSATLFLAVLLLFIGQIMLDFFQGMSGFLESNILYILIALRFAVVFVVFLVAISSIYYFAPAVHDRWRFFSVGSISATVLSIMVSYGFSFYISNFGTYNKLYGSIGAMIAFMFWLFLISVILLTGFEINASLDKASFHPDKKKMLPAESEKINVET